MKSRVLVYFTVILTAACFALPVNAATSMSKDEAYEIGMEAYIYLYPAL